MKFFEKNTLETSEEDEKIHSKRVKKMKKYTRKGWEDEYIHSKRVEKMNTYTRNEIGVEEITDQAKQEAKMEKTLAKLKEVRVSHSFRV